MEVRVSYMFLERSSGFGIFPELYRRVSYTLWVGCYVWLAALQIMRGQFCILAVNTFSTLEDLNLAGILYLYLESKLDASTPYISTLHIIIIFHPTYPPMLLLWTYPPNFCSGKRQHSSEIKQFLKKDVAWTIAYRSIIH